MIPNSLVVEIYLGETEDFPFAFPQKKNSNFPKECTSAGYGFSGFCFNNFSRSQFERSTDARYWKLKGKFSGFPGIMLLEAPCLSNGSEFFTGTDRQTDDADKVVMHTLSFRW
jgi:hypothetical protein